MPVDYLLRLFEWTRQTLIAISQKREAGGYGPAREEIEKACLRVTGLSFNLIRRYSPEALFDLMQLGTDPYLRSIFLAELLIQYAQISQEEGNIVDEIASNLQAYYLLSESIGLLPPVEEAAYRSKLEILAQKLSVYRDNPYVREKLTTRLGFPHKQEFKS
jgi:hypothetical protein